MALVAVLVCMTSCVSPGPPDISPEHPDVVSLDGQNWYIYHSSEMPAHPSPDSHGGWSFDLPNQADGLVRYVQTPFRVTKTLQSVTIDFAVTSEDAKYHVIDTTDKPPATVHIFFERQNDNLAEPDGRWWADTSKYELGSYDNHAIRITVPLTHDYWTNVYGQHDSQSFYDSLAKAGWIGITFGGQKFWANGVAIKAGKSKFVLYGFSVK